MTNPRMTMAARWAGFTPYFHSLLRIVAGLMFTLAGTMKVFSFPTGMPMPINLASQVGVGGILEVVCGALLLVGLFTRPVAFLMAGQMAVAYFQFHLPKSFWPVMNGGVTAALYCFIWLYMSAAGAGPLSVDAWRSNRKRDPEQVVARAA